LRKKFRIPAQPVLVAALLVFAAAAQGEEALVREVYTMGTTLRLVSLESDHERALRQSEILIRAVEEADQQLSTWKEESELSKLNRQPVNEPFAASHQLIDLIAKIQMWSGETDRAFDPGIGNLLDLWNVHGSFRIPGPREIQDALSSSGIAYLNLDSTHGSITKLKQIIIDPGAFGKGEGLQRAIEIAREQNMAPLLLDFGGQIAVHGKPPGNNGWVVQLADPLLRDQVQKQGFVLKDGSFSTSGFSERSGKVNGRIINHIMDPRTGQPAPLFGSVTVWHPDALVADILSTALYVMGPTEGYKWASYHCIAAAFSSENGVLKTKNFK
jgi:thiamine biosynthesis lipoprotein